MAVIAEFTVSHTDFVLEHVFDAYPDATIELDRVVPTDEAFLPYFWVWDADVEGVVAVVEDAEPLTAVTLVDDVEGGGLFYARWTRDFDGLLEGMERSGLTLRKAVGTADDWQFEFRAEALDELPQFQRYLTDNDVAATLTRMYDLDAEATSGRYNLTAEQREALLLAYDAGYYETPARTDLATLARELGISRSAFGERLKRGYGNLIEATIAHEQDPGDV